MGCCISKCKPNKTPHLNPNLQDKVVISQSPPSSPPPSSPPQKQKTSQSPPSITSSSFTCSTTQTSTCDSSLLSSESSCSSSVAFSHVDRLFSNEFLQSCVKQNPQIVRLDPVKRILEVKQLAPGNTQKRPRAMSPTLTRQKSFRVEKERSPNARVNGRSTIMRSPSPSRRFNGYTSDYQRPPTTLSSTNMRPMSPNRKNIINKERPMYLKNNKERFGYEIGSKVGVEVDQGLSKVNYLAPLAMEDIDNPHIALDCFIFL